MGHATGSLLSLEIDHGYIIHFRQFALNQKHFQHVRRAIKAFVYNKTNTFFSLKFQITEKTFIGVENVANAY